MKTFIVPTDFSETAKNAALYAAELAEAVQDARILLYNAFSPILPGSDGSPLSDDPEARKKVIELALENVKMEMLVASPPANISWLAEESNSLSDNLEKIVQKENADLIIMGITGTSPIEQAIIGSNALKIMHRNFCPLIIVPPHAHFKGIQNVLFATDYKEVEKTTPAEPLRAVLNLFMPFIHVVHVNEALLEELPDEYVKERSTLEAILEGYKTEFHLIRQSDFVEAISQFAADKNIDLILTVPHKQTFLGKLFAGSHTKKLVYHSHVPIIAVQEQISN